LLFCIFFSLTLSSATYAQGHSILDRAHQRIDSITPKPLKIVEVETQSREAFEAFLKKQIKRSFSRTELQDLSKTFALLGVIPDTYSLQRKLVDLYRNQAGAYYDPANDVIRQLSGPLPDSALYFLYLHELVHAYQDQHYDLMAKQNELRGKSFDTKMAFTFVTEGHANLLSTLVLLGKRNLSSRYFRNGNHRGILEILAGFPTLAPDQLKTLGQLNPSTSAFSRQIRQLVGVPDILIQVMLDPYLLGELLWYDHAANAGWPDAENWLVNPPTSTRGLLYQSGESSISLPGDDQEPSRFSTTAGVYFLLRWTNKLDARPNWGAELMSDRLRLISTSTDSFVNWSLHFESVRSARNFSSQLTTGANTGNEGTPTVTIRRYAGPRYLSLFRKDNVVELFIDDDQKRANYEPYF
jgi:hypothetical protein